MKYLNCLVKSRRLVSHVRSLEVVTVLTSENVNKLKVNNTSYIHKGTRSQDKPLLPKLERLTGEYRRSELSGTKALE